MQKNNKHTGGPRVDKVTISYTRVPPKDPPKEGDRKMIKGVMHVRRQMMTRSMGQLCSLVSRGRPVYEWVTEEVYKEGYRLS